MTADALVCAVCVYNADQCDGLSDSCGEEYVIVWDEVHPRGPRPLRTR